MKMKRESRSKKQIIHVSNNLIALTAILFTMASLIVDYNVYQNAKSRLAGEVVSAGSMELCLNSRPSLSNCQSTATVGTLYTCDIDMDTNQILTVSVNSSLFNVNNYGIISFTPSSPDVGFHAVEINASDNSGCGNSNNTLLFNLRILANTPPKINITKLAFTSINNITLIGTYSADDTLANITIELNSSNKVLTGFKTLPKTWSAAVNLTEGWNKFYVLAYDASGNFANVTSSSQGASVLLDTTKPAINLATPQNESSVANNSLIAFKITDLSLANSFYTINSGATASFNSVYELKVGTSGWRDGANEIIVNATDFTGNVERKSFTFRYSNGYSIVLNNSIITTQNVINDTNNTIINLQDSSAMQSLVNNFAALVPVGDYNKTLQSLNVVANLSNAVSSVQSLLQDILAANSSNQSDAAKTDTINTKLDEISVIKNTTVSSVDVNLFNPNLTVEVKNSTKISVANQLIASVAGLSAADQQSFTDASAELQNKTTITNKVQTLTKTFLNGRAENITLFEKNVSISQTQSGQFYVNEFIDKNITGTNNLNANMDITNRVSQPMIVVVADPTIRWSFSNSEGGVIGYTINQNVPFDNVAKSETVVTTVPTAGNVATTSGGGGSSGGGLGGGGGGGGGPAAAQPSNKTEVSNFATDRDLIKAVLKQGESKTYSFKIKNTADTKIDISIDTDLGNYITIKEKKITLDAGGEKEISFDVKVNDNPDVYTGKIFLASDYLNKEIKLILEVKPVVSLFDVKVLVPNQYKQVPRGSSVAADIALINIGDPAEVALFYSVRNTNNEEIVSNEEKIYVKEPLLITRELKIPSSAGINKYIFYVSMTAGSNKAFASDIFEIVKAPFINFPAQFNFGIKAAIMLVFVVLLIITYYNISRRKLKKEGEKDVPSFDVKLSLRKMNPKRLENLRNKINKELDVLNADYQSGYISFEEHKKIKEKLENQLGKLK